jgi:hypothetical protein
LDTALRVAQQIRFEDALDTSLMNRNFMRETGWDSNILHDGRTLNDSFLVF